MSDINPNELPPLDVTALEQELKKESQFGSRPIEAALGSAASAATFGLSDAALVEAGVSPERLREVRDRESTASTLGTAAGIVGPALATMGTSTAAQAAGAGVKAVTAAGRAAELAAAEALVPALGKTAGTIAAKGVGGAAEGALAGAGQLVSDVALERKDLSAESALATVGTGALLGGGFGVALGTAQATLAPAAKKITSLSSKVKKVAEEGLEEITDPVEASLRVTSDTPAQRLKLRERLGSNAEALPTYLKENLELGTLSTPSQLLSKNAEVVEAAGKQIGAISKRLDELTAEGSVVVSRAEAYSPLLKRVDDELEKLGPARNATASERRILNRYRNDIIAFGANEAPFSFTEFDKFRKILQGKKFKGGGALESFEANLADGLRWEARQVVDTIAQAASEVEPALSAGLKKANKTYAIGSTLEPFLETVAERKPGLSSPLDFIADTTARSARNAAVINDIAARTAQVQKTISDSVKSFFNKPRSAKISVSLPSTQVLLNSGFSIDQDTNKVPTTKDQAFTNIKKNIVQFQEDPEKLVELIAKRTVRVANADAGVAAAMQSSLANAVQFLGSKIPLNAAPSGLFAKPYKPSSLELAKFERYLQVIEKPLTVLADLEKGTLTREHAEALKAVYPELYKEIQQTALQYVVDGKNVPYEKRVQLGILLDIPADSSLDSETILSLQASFQPSEDQPPVNTTVSGLQNVEVASRMSTDVQKVQQS